MTDRGLLQLADADREMEERAQRAKELLQTRYSGLKRNQERKAARRLILEKRMVNLGENQKRTLRTELAREEVQAAKESRRKVTTADFEPLAVIGRGAFGEVTLVRRKSRSEDSSASYGKVYALKSMKKELMVRKNQVQHIKAEREALSMADERYKWLTHLHYSFQDENTLYMVLEFMPGGDLMGLLIKEDTFTEPVTKFFMAEAAHAISAIHALGYVHRDIKPDNMLIDEHGHLKLTDLGLCKKIGDVRPDNSPNAVLEVMKRKSGSSGMTPPSPQSCITSFACEDSDLFALACDDLESTPTTATHHGHAVTSTPERTQRRELARSTVGTPDYIAPEVLAAQNGNCYDSSVDWWSLGCIMFECLVGYPPFYSDDPVSTCRKIMRWKETLRIPSATRKTLSSESVDFLACLITDTHSRVGSTANPNVDSGTNGFARIVNHPWYGGFDWDNLGKGRGPFLPCCSEEFPALLEELKTCPKDHPRCKRIIERLTVNFDTFENECGSWYAIYDSDDATTLSTNTRVGVPHLDEFYDYQFTRNKRPKVPGPETFDCLGDSQVSQRMEEMKVE